MAFYPLATETWNDAETKALERVIASRQFSMGPEVKAFEKQFATYFGSRFALMVNSGSSANLLAIAGLVYHPDKLLKPGDEVLVPPVSWGTTYYPISQLGLSLRFVDIDPATLNINPDLIEAAITPKTRAVLAVNLLGNPCDFARLQDICARHNLLLIEDNCESMGATFDGKPAGTFGRCGTFSTFFSHHISTMEGGVVVTDDEALYHTFLSLRAHGWVREQPPHSHLAVESDPFLKLFRFVLPGYNLRPLEMEGALGQEQLKKLPALVANRQENGALFRKMMASVENIRLQKETGKSSWFGFALVLEGALAGHRRALVERLMAAGIECRPIVAGNFLNNPVIKLLPHTLGSPIVAAEAVDQNGLFLGNHHYNIVAQLEKTRDILASSAKECRSCAA
ncbi:MAG: DegT/DnrJ/EryC1/StrS family aminotransferase [Alphaproteobacteria bacterium]|nr:DegT/DnrJ/EryC1/StrS family aminotransferase [Alphaproteobacteria bacterium]